MAFYNDFINQGESYAQARQLTEDYYQEIVLTVRGFEWRSAAAGPGGAHDAVFNTGQARPGGSEVSFGDLLVDTGLAPRSS